MAKVPTPRYSRNTVIPPPGEIVPAMTGEQFRALRVAVGFNSQDELAQWLGCHRTAIIRHEQDGPPVALGALFLLMQWQGIPPSEVSIVAKAALAKL